MKAIITKYLPCTNYKGSRIKATDTRKNHVTIPYPYELNTDEAHLKAALALCKKIGWSTNLIGGGLENGNYVFVFADSTPRNID